MVSIICQSCGEPYDVPEQARGKKALCPVCGEETPVPSMTVVTSSNLSLTSGRLDPPIISSMFSHPAMRLVFRLFSVLVIVAILTGALVLIREVLLQVTHVAIDEEEPRVADPKPVEDPPKPEIIDVQRVYSALMQFRENLGRLPASLEELERESLTGRLNDRYLYFPKSALLTPPEEYVLLAETGPSDMTEREVLYVGGRRTKLDLSDYETELAETRSALAIAKAAAEKAATALKRERYAASVLADAEKLEAAGKTIPAYEAYRKLRLKYSDTTAVRKARDLIEEKERGLLFRIRLEEARDVCLRAAQGEVDQVIIASDLYNSLAKDYPDARQSLNSEKSVWLLASKASQLSRRGLYDMALKTLKLIAEQDDLFWKRFACIRTKAINSRLDSAKRTFLLAVGAEKRKEYSTAYRLYVSVITNAPKTRWAADATRSKDLLVLTMPYGKRFQEKGRFLLPAMRKSINQALDYLSRHQDDSGRWGVQDFTECCTSKPACHGTGKGEFDVGVTALALLAFLGEGNTHFSGRYAGVVRKGLKFLIDSQDKEGFIGKNRSKRWLYNHALALRALGAAYGMTTDESLRKPAAAAIKALTDVQLIGKGWTYGASTESDTSLTCVSGVALASARKAGLSMPDTALTGTRNTIRAATDLSTGAVSYRKRTKDSGSFPLGDKPSGLPVLPAQAALTRVLLGDKPSDAAVTKALELIGKNLPAWDSGKGGRINFYYWYYATLALHTTSDKGPKEWTNEMHHVLTGHQEKEGCAAGSWPPQGRWCSAAGRIYSTVMSVLILQAPYNRPADFFAGPGE